MQTFMTRLGELTYKHLTDDLSHAEQLELDTRLSNSPEEKELFDTISNPQWIKEQLRYLYKIDHAKAWKNILKRFKNQQR